MGELKPCPFCGNTEFEYIAYSLAPECYLTCSCGISLELSVPWEDNMTEAEHDKVCLEKLKEVWNRRADNVEM